MDVQPRMATAGDCRMRDLQWWILNNLSGDLTLKTMAARSEIGVRHFTRIFQKESGTTAGDFVEMARVDAARRLLKEPDMKLWQVAAHCGFANADIMRRVFLRRLGIKPSLYRANLRHV
jgi:transcriptional regulator GlxA family with amidase domain